MKKETIDLIPKNKFYDSMDLLEDLIKKEKKYYHFHLMDAV